MINGFGTPIATVETTRTQYSITVDNIPQTYSELFIVTHSKSLGSGTGFAGGGATDWDELNINNDYNVNYARQTMYLSNNGSYNSTRNFNVPRIYGEQITGSSSDFTNEYAVHIWHLPNYSNTSQWKNIYLLGGRVGTAPNTVSGFNFAVTGVYKSTNGIKRLDFGSSYGYLAGTTVEIFGTKRLGL